VDSGFFSGSKGDSLFDVNLINSAFQQLFLQVKQPDYKAEHSPRHTVEVSVCETISSPLYAFVVLSLGIERTLSFTFAKELYGLDSKVRKS